MVVCTSRRAVTWDTDRRSSLWEGSCAMLKTWGYAQPFLVAELTFAEDLRKELPQVYRPTEGERLVCL